MRSFYVFLDLDIKRSPQKGKVSSDLKIKMQAVGPPGPVCVMKGLVPTLLLSWESREGGRQTRKRGVVNNLQGDGGSTQHIQTETLNFHVRVSVGSRLEVKYEHRHRRVRLKLSECLYF